MCLLDKFVNVETSKLIAQSASKIKLSQIIKRVNHQSTQIRIYCVVLEVSLICRRAISCFNSAVT